MGAITDNVQFTHIAREWRCKWAEEDDKKTLTAAQAALDALEEQLQERLQVCTEYVDVALRGSKQDPPEIESVEIDAVSDSVKELIVGLWHAKKEAKEISAEVAQKSKAFKEEIKRLEPAVGEALRGIPGASSTVEGAARPVYVRRKTHWVHPRIDLRGEIGPIIDEAMVGASAGDTAELPASSLLQGLDILDRREMACRITLDDAAEATNTD